MIEPFSFVLGLLSLPALVYIGVAILLTIEVAYDLGWLATVTAGVFGALGWWNGWFSFDWITHNWFGLVLAFGLYVLAGIAWTVVKWWFYINALARDLRDQIKHGSTMPIRVPQVSDHKSDIMRWLCWWPFSMLGTMLNDPFRRLFEAIYRLLGEFLQEMANRTFAGIKLPDSAPRDRYEP